MIRTPVYASDGAVSSGRGFCIFLMITSTAIRIMIPTGSEIHALFVNPATMYVINDIDATVIAYGICVATWATWLHLAPALDMIVVSEIGEQ